MGIKLDDAAISKMSLKWVKDSWVSTKVERIDLQDEKSHLTYRGKTVKRSWKHCEN